MTTWGTIVPLIGGLTVAAEQATQKKPDFFISYGAFGDNERHAKNYYPDVPFHLLDDGSPKPQLGEVDFVNAVCPCAGLSQLSSGGPEARAARNAWMFETAKYVLNDVKPKVFWGENAPTFYTSAGKHVRDELIDIAQKAGYSFSAYATNTLLHGIPQARKRTFYFFWRDHGAPIFGYYNKPRKNISEYLAEVPKGIKHHEQKDLDDAVYRLKERDKLIWFFIDKFGPGYLQEIRDSLYRNNKNNLSILAYVIDHGLMSEAKAFFEKNGWAKETRWIGNIMEKLAANKGIWDGTLQLVKPDGNFMTLIHRTMQAMHPVEDRCLTLRECMHLMGLPHDFNLVLDDKGGVEWNHVCQNVPVCTGADMTREVLAVLAGERKITSSRVLRQSNLTNEIDEQEIELAHPNLEF